MAKTEYGNVEQGVSISQEVSRKNKNKNVPAAGLYRHPNGTEALIQSDELYGNAQAQGFARLGFVFVRDIEPGEVKTIPEMAMVERKADEDSMKGLSARMAALETVADENKALQAEVATLRAEKAAREEADRVAAEELAAKEAAEKLALEAAEKSEEKAEEVATDEVEAEKVKTPEVKIDKTKK